MNKSEDLVFKLCTKTFLSLWSYANPLGKDPNKELCDILVVCDPDIIIISVKEIEFKKSKDPSVDYSRWYNRSINKSCSQIYGAERFIKSAKNVTRKDGSLGLPLPPPSMRRIHRIAVALGGQGKLPIIFGDFGKGFVHVFDEVSLDVVLKELDTITDFVSYIVAKEELYRDLHERGLSLLVDGGEEDLLAYYLRHERSFPKHPDNTNVILDNTLWKSLLNDKGYKGKQLADKISYAWDSLIEVFAKDILQGNLVLGSTLNDMEQIVRVMAREDRFVRRMLGEAFSDFIKRSAGASKIRSRIIISPFSGIIYVLLVASRDYDREARLAELFIRCKIARGLYKVHKTVVGIASEQYDASKGYSLDGLYLYKENWTTEDQVEFENLRREFTYFSNIKQTEKSYEEYPQTQ